MTPRFRVFVQLDSGGNVTVRTQQRRDDDGMTEIDCRHHLAPGDTLDIHDDEGSGIFIEHSAK